MRVSTMRRVDRWLGTPACAALTVYDLVKKVLGGGRCPADTSPSSIAFVKLAEQGSTILAWSAIANAIARVGRNNVYFVVFEENRHVLDAAGWLPEANIVSIRGRNPLSVLADTVLAVLRLRRLKPGAVVDMEFFARSSAILAYLSGSPRRIGFHAFHGEARYRGDLLTHRIAFNPYVHTSQAFEILVNALDESPRQLPAYACSPPAARPLPAFEPTLEETESVRRMLGTEGCLSRVVLLNANASDLIPLRRWPNDRYVALARKVLERYADAMVLFTGAPNERAGTEPLARAVGSRRCVSVAGQTTFRELLTLYTLADVLVTNDSGPAHFAALTPIETIALFGPETPALFAALTPRYRALTAGLVCSPCLNAFNDRQSPCTNNLCMQAITVERVFEEVVNACERRRTASVAAT